MFRFKQACWVAAAAALGILAPAAQAAEHYGFDSSAEGWTADNGGTLIYSGSGGNSGGFLEIADASNGDFVAVLPVGGGGNWSAYLGGTISFDAINFNNKDPDWGLFGRTTLSGNGFTLIVDPVTAGEPPADGQWHHFVVPLTTALWGADLVTVLANVDGLSIQGEFHGEIAEIVGLDNIEVAGPVPEPASVALWLVGLAGLAAIRRRG